MLLLLALLLFLLLLLAPPPLRARAARSCVAPNAPCASEDLINSSIRRITRYSSIDGGRLISYFSIIAM
jgi:hypothetical protein